LVYRWFASFWRYVERQRERELYADIHARLYAQGYTHQISFYGTLAEPYDGKHNQARIEVVANDELDPVTVSALYEALDHFIPNQEYTLFAMTKDGLRGIEAR
jgi:hypothetical protein